MEKDKEIIEAMLGMVYEKARSVYSETIVEYGTNPTHYGVITDPDGYASVTGTWGDTIAIFLRVRDKKIEDAKFSTDGCLFTIAASEAVTRMAEGKTAVECLRINQSAILGRLENVPEDHEHCALIAAMAFQKALRECAIGNQK